MRAQFYLIVVRNSGVVIGQSICEKTHHKVQ